MPRVLLIHDQSGSEVRPDEADTLAQAEAIEAALSRRGHAVERLAVGLDLAVLERRLRQGDIDAVFNGMESLGGHANLVAAAAFLVESLGVPLAGCCARAIHLTSDKPLAKRVLRAAGLPTPMWRTREEIQQGATIGLPAIVKSAWEHASVGLGDHSVIHQAGPGAHGADTAAAAAVDLAAVVSGQERECFVEEFVDGREIVIGVLPPAGRPSSESPLEVSRPAVDDDHGPGPSPQILPPAEIRFLDWPSDRPRIVGFAAKWQEESLEAQRTVPCLDFPAHDQPLLDRLRAMALDCWRTLAIDGHARVDFRVDRLGRPWILEVNANPCLTPGAGFARMLAAAGIEYDEAIERLVQVAIAGRAHTRTASTARAADRRVRRSPAVALRRSLVEGDVAAVAALVASTCFFNDEEVAVAAELVQETLGRGADAGYEFLMADTPDGALAGYACIGRVPFTRSAWDLYWIAVAPQHQAQGLGRRLLAAALEVASAAGGTALYSDTAGRAQYQPTRDFYERAGGRVVARLRDYYAPGDDRVTYVFDLPGQPGPPVPLCEVEV